MQNVLTNTYGKIIDNFPRRTWGVLLLIGIAAIAKLLGMLIPLIGSILFAIMIGIGIRNFIGVKQVFEPGLAFTLKKLLKAAIVMLGASLSFAEIMLVGKQSILIMVVAVLMGIMLTIGFGKLLDVNPKLSLMIGIGTSICGATAISCVKGILDSKEEETAYAISTIVFFNLIAFILYPIIGHVIHLTSTQFGIWAGTAVHDTSSAVAVGYVYGDAAGQVATTVKLARTLFLLPVIIILGVMLTKKGEGTKASLKQAFPWFVIWFLLVSIINSVGLIPETVSASVTDIAKYIILMVMAAVGLQVNIKQLMKLGIKPLLTGLFASVSVAATSLLLIYYVV
ncbi:YeiH family protein [Pseudalkalibacillus caeni]|uniref:Putative sulfate exporter family transporter n=1 Tax=Exobacillus caeni TaxID=2574798 RepID=A0A5R9F2J2_9BACL|nr:putative sulfate exporter family transporter [Pseudalkalibacillus caeni]TLS36749.1 putative sulfate exporter family transporter [Pseudalkalibacillus caeni]